MLFVVLCLGAPEDSTGSGFGLKRLRRRGHSLKSHPKDWESRTPVFKASDLSTTPWWISSHTLHVKCIRLI